MANAGLADGMPRIRVFLGICWHVHICGTMAATGPRRYSSCNDLVAACSCRDHRACPNPNCDVWVGDLVLPALPEEADAEVRAPVCNLVGHCACRRLLRARSDLALGRRADSGHIAFVLFNVLCSRIGRIFLYETSRLSGLSPLASQPGCSAVAGIVLKCAMYFVDPGIHIRSDDTLVACGERGQFPLQACHATFDLCESHSIHSKCILILYQDNRGCSNRARHSRTLAAYRAWA